MAGVRGYSCRNCWRVLKHDQFPACQRNAWRPKCSDCEKARGAKNCAQTDAAKKGATDAAKKGVTDAAKKGATDAAAAAESVGPKPAPKKLKAPKNLKEEWPHDLPKASQNILRNMKHLVCKDCRMLGNVWRNTRNKIVAVFCNNCCNAIASHADAHCSAKHLVDTMGNIKVVQRAFGCNG